MFTCIHSILPRGPRARRGVDLRTADSAICRAFLHPLDWRSDPLGNGGHCVLALSFQRWHQTRLLTPTHEERPLANVASQLMSTQRRGNRPWCGIRGSLLGRWEPGVVAWQNKVLELCDKDATHACQRPRPRKELSRRRRRSFSSV